jgi:hypothetical protein
VKGYRRSPPSRAALARLLKESAKRRAAKDDILLQVCFANLVMCKVAEGARQVQGPQSARLLKGLARCKAEDRAR